MINDIAFNERLGVIRFLVWSKENPIYRLFYRTTIAGHWDKNDVAEFNKCGAFYEIHFDHRYDDDAHSFALMVMQRCDNFKAAKVSRLAVNNMKVIILMGQSGEYRERIAYLARLAGFELGRVRSKSDQASNTERYMGSKVGHYFKCLKNMFAPSAGRRVKPGP